jgi:phosphoglycolate phosphatase
VVFDLDGTLLDTLDDLWQATNHALAAFDMPSVTRDEVRRFVGNGYARLIRLATPDGCEPELQARVLDAFNSYYLAHAQDHTHPYDGIVELLSQLRERQLPMAVVSNKGDAAVRELVDAVFPQVFASAAGERTGVRRKPAPDTVLAVCASLGVDAHDIVYVGDSEVDVQTARNVGCPCISVTWGFRTVAQLREAGATTFVDHPHELLKLLVA